MKNTAEELFKVKIDQLEKELAEKKRELEIEAALERVRSRTMAMHRSDELLDAGKLLYRELSKLLIVSMTSGYVIMDDEEKIGWIYAANPADGTILPKPNGLPHESKVMGSIKASWKKQEPFHVIELDPQATIEHHTYLAKNSVDFLFTLEEFLSMSPERIVMHSFNFKQGYLLVVGPVRLTAEQQEMVIRFTKVFEMTYRRFLDLKQAEAQVREGQIQLALERVRARSMAMHHSNELSEAANLLFKQVHALCEPVWSCGYNIWEINEKICTGWMSSEGIVQPPFHFPLTENPTFIRFYESRQKGETFYTEKVEGEQLAAHYRYMLSLPEFKEIAADFLNVGFSLPESQINHVVNFKNGNLIFISNSPVPEAHDIFKRFAKVFEQTYTRFLDLQKAEAQAREAKIEAALERLRGRAMAMQSSDELAAVVKLMYIELRKLDDSLTRCMIMIFDEQTEGVTWWIAGDDEAVTDRGYRVPYSNYPPQLAFLQGWKQRRERWQLTIEGDVKKDWDEFLFTQTELSGLPPVVIQNMRFFDKIFLSASFAAFGGLTSGSVEPLNTASFDILVRFSKVFDLIYTRFNDLKRAEAQATEARIEAALERVRSRSLSMHKSEELKEVMVVVFEKLKELGLVFEGAGIQLFTEGSKEIIQWVAAPDHLAAPILVVLPYTEEDYKESEIIRDMLLAKEKGISVYNKSYSFNEKNSFFKYAGRYNDFDQIPVRVRAFQMQASSYIMSLVAEKHSALWTDSYFGRTISEQGFTVLKRTAKVFEQAYIRFLDLKGAEAQAREAQIQLALERVRARTMAMQKSDELTNVAAVLFQQVADLGINAWTTGFNVWSKDNNYYTDYITSPSGGFIEPYTIEAISFPAFKEISDARKRGEEFYVSFLEGEMLKQTYQELGKFGDQKQYEKMLEGGFEFPTHQFNHFVFGSKVSLLFITYEPVPEAYDVFKRFGKVFEQTYTRFLDLKRAEAQARAATIEAALEKIRSRSLGMQRSDELKDVVAVLFDKLKELGLVFDGGAGIHLFTENSRDAEIWVRSPEVVAPVCSKLPYDEVFANNPIIIDVWKAKDTGEHIINKTYSFQEKNNYFDYVFKHNDTSVLPEPVRRFIKNTESYTATFISEKNSLLGANSWTRQLFSESDIMVFKRVAKVFEQAYVRFLDLQKAEAQAIRAEQDLIDIKAARKKAEDTLTELRATQQQLIQKEKMASLGELTAGIAHEIQNPLNFVNNFSEVNTELIEELKSQKAKVKSERDEELEGDLLNDIAENEQKINHHGKRADAIVKGMLQHSRASTGKKELTDINALTDEYLRLSYHGLRAKDKSFNATMQTNFDESIGKIDIVPQDIGRVLLNLFNNAFYAVSERRKAEGLGYEPTVLVTTKHSLSVGEGRGEVTISVKDNGIGMPQKALDKIFQPFFTTKPTGQGTGLGLSLSYDIIKAHGGELKVETKEGEGAEFIIQLPIPLIP